MIPLSLNVYILVLATLAISLFTLSAVFTFLLRRKFIKNIKEEIANIFPIISPMFDNSIIWADLSGSISFINDYASKLLKINLEDFKDLKLKSIFESEIDAERIRLLEQGKPIKIQTNFISKDNEVIPVELSAVLVAISNVSIGYILIADNLHVEEIKRLRVESDKCKKFIEEQKNGEEKHTKKINDLYGVINALLDDPKETGVEQKEILKKITKDLGILFDTYLTICWLTKNGQNDGEELELIEQYGLSDEGIKKMAENLPTGDKMMESMVKKQILITNVSSMDDSLRVFLEEEGVLAIADVPFFKNGEIFGILEFYLKNNEDGNVSREILSYASTLISAIFSIFDIKISNAEDVERLRREKDKEIDNLMSKIKYYDKEMEEMKRFQELTVGRELKMIELKREMEEFKNSVKDNELK